MLGRKTKRPENKDKEIELLTSKKTENFKLILYKLEKAKELYSEYEAEKSEIKKWKIINNIIELVEINPKYNYEFLKMNQIYKKKDYEENFKQLGPTLSKEDFFSLSKTEHKNPSLVLFELLNLLLKNEKKFDEETKKIINNNYNIPLIEGNERIRINYYLRLLAHFEVFLNDKQKKYLLDEKNKISDDDKNKIKLEKDKYDNIKKGIKFFKDIIPNMTKFFQNINIEENNFNIKIFTFMLYITDIYQRIEKSRDETIFTKNFFLKEIEPTIELLENKSLVNIINLKKYDPFPKNFGIKKKYENKEIDVKDKEKDRKMYEYVIFNKFESIDFDGRNYVINNLADVERRVTEACKRAGRCRDEVTLIAVSKTKPVSDLQAVYDLGARDFGENKVQELTDKIEKMPDDIRWHMIGHLQRNKVKYIVGNVALIHSVDSLRLAEEISKQAVKKDVNVDILVEINIGNEESKFGISTDEVKELVKDIAKLQNIKIKGLMCVAPYVVDSEENRPFFHKIKDLSVDIMSENIDNVTMDVLSMGMSNDYQVAIEEGATMVRIGSDLFGKRDYSKL